MNLEQLINTPNPPPVGEIIRSIISAPHIALSITEAARKLSIGRPAFSNVINGNAGLSRLLAFSIEQSFQFEAEALLKYQAVWQYREFIKLVNRDRNRAMSAPQRRRDYARIST